MLLSLFYNSSNDIWCLNLDSYRWQKQFTLGDSPLPEPRYGQSQIELGEKHLLVLGKTLNSAYEIDFFNMEIDVILV